MDKLIGILLITILVTMIIYMKLLESRVRTLESTIDYLQKVRFKIEITDKRQKEGEKHE